jgi:hypothetical protein
MGPVGQEEYTVPDGLARSIRLMCRGDRALNAPQANGAEDTLARGNDPASSRDSHTLMLPTRIDYDMYVHDQETARCPIAIVNRTLILHSSSILALSLHRHCGYTHAV